MDLGCLIGRLRSAGVAEEVGVPAGVVGADSNGLLIVAVCVVGG